MSTTEPFDHIGFQQELGQPTFVELITVAKRTGKAIDYSKRTVPQTQTSLAFPAPIRADYGLHTLAPAVRLSANRITNLKISIQWLNQFNPNLDWTISGDWKLKTNGQLRLDFATVWAVCHYNTGNEILKTAIMPDSVSGGTSWTNNNRLGSILDCLKTNLPPNILLPQPSIAANTWLTEQQSTELIVVLPPPTGIPTAIEIMAYARIALPTIQLESPDHHLYDVALPNNIGIDEAFKRVSARLQSLSATSVLINNSKPQYFKLTTVIDSDIYDCFKSLTDFKASKAFCLTSMALFNGDQYRAAEAGDCDQLDETYATATLKPGNSVSYFNPLVEPPISGSEAPLTVRPNAAPSTRINEGVVGHDGDTSYIAFTRSKARLDANGVASHFAEFELENIPDDMVMLRKATIRCVCRRVNITSQKTVLRFSINGGFTLGDRVFNANHWFTKYHPLGDYELLETADGDVLPTDEWVLYEREMLLPTSTMASVSTSRLLESLTNTDIKVSNAAWYGLSRRRDFWASNSGRMIAGVNLQARALIDSLPIANVGNITSAPNDVAYVITNEGTNSAAVTFTDGNLLTWGGNPSRYSTVILRFDGNSIPPNSFIHSANITLTAASTNDGSMAFGIGLFKPTASIPTNLTDINNYSSTIYRYLSRIVDAGLWTKDNTYSIDVKELVSAITNESWWTANSQFQFVIATRSFGAVRSAYSYNQDSTKAATLTINHSVGTDDVTIDGPHVRVTALQVDLEYYKQLSAIQETYCIEQIVDKTVALNTLISIPIKTKASFYRNYQYPLANYAIISGPAEATIREQLGVPLAARNNVPLERGDNRYYFEWTPTIPGEYTIIIKAKHLSDIDTDFNATTSFKITVLSDGDLPDVNPTNNLSNTINFSAVPNRKIYCYSYFVRYVIRNPDNAADTRVYNYYPVTVTNIADANVAKWVAGTGDLLHSLTFRYNESSLSSYNDGDVKPVAGVDSGITVTLDSASPAIIDHLNIALPEPPAGILESIELLGLVNADAMPIAAADADVLAIAINYTRDGLQKSFSNDFDTSNLLVAGDDEARWENFGTFVLDSPLGDGLDQDDSLIQDQLVIGEATTINLFTIKVSVNSANFSSSSIPLIPTPPPLYTYDIVEPAHPLAEATPATPQLRDSANFFSEFHYERELFDPANKYTIRQLALLKGYKPSDFNAYIKSNGNHLEPVDYGVILQNSQSVVLIATVLDSTNNRQRILSQLASRMQVLPMRMVWPES